MATIVLIGPDSGLLEGLSQTLANDGHRPQIAGSFAEAAEQWRAEPPLVAVVERSLACASADSRKLAMKAGRALVLFHASAEEEATLPTLPAALQRATIAELALPLEKHRLTALVQHVEERAHATGRHRRPTPPEHRAV